MPNTRPLRIGKFVVNNVALIVRLHSINVMPNWNEPTVPKNRLNCGDSDVSMAMDVPYFRCGGMSVVK